VPTTCLCPEPDRSSPYPKSHFLKIHLNIILPSTPGPSKLPLPHRFPHQNPVYTSPLSHTFYMHRSSYFSLFDYPNNIEWSVQIIKLLIMVLFFINVVNKPSRFNCINTARRSLTLRVLLQIHSKYKTSICKMKTTENNVNSFRLEI